MKLSLLYLLVIVVVAGYIGTLIARDPGYVLVSYDGMSMQTSLWVFVALVLVLSFLIYAIIRTYRLIRRSRFMVTTWQADRKVKRADRLSSKGMRLLAEGDYVRARRFLEGATDDSTEQGLSLLAAARAADATGDAKARETFLRQAGERDNSLERARATVAAELAIQRGDPKTAMAELAGVKMNAHVAELQTEALQQLADWQETLSAIGELAKFDPLSAQQLEIEATIAGFKHLSGRDDQVTELYKARSKVVKDNSDVLVAYANALRDDSPVEPLLRSALKKSWQSILIVRYGELGDETLTTRRKSAEGWLKQHVDDPALQYCLGSIYLQANEPGMARDALSLASAGGVLEAHEPLARLLVEDGQYQRGYEELSKLLH